MSYDETPDRHYTRDYSGKAGALDQQDQDGQGDLKKRTQFASTVCRTPCYDNTIGRA
jgi:hypothetical protein